MKKTGIIILLVMFCLNVKAQVNLVPNGSFEDTVACPVNGRLYNCMYWVNCGQTPDYNHSCAPQGNAFGVPFNTVGYQPAATGNAYCDLWTYSTTQLFREFIGVSLIQPMVIGHSYFVSFRCAPASPGHGYCLQTNKQGIRFSTIAYDSVNTAPINNFAHIYSDSIISDTVNWTTISGSFIADSVYAFLTIGNFYDDAYTDTLIPGFQCAAFAVYYIDDVEVIDSTTGINETNYQYLIRCYQRENELVIHGPQSICIEAELFDCMGKRIQCSTDRTDSGLIMAIGSLSSGIYVARVNCQNKVYSIKCFIH